MPEKKTKMSWHARIICCGAGHAYRQWRRQYLRFRRAICSADMPRAKQCARWRASSPGSSQKSASERRLMQRLKAGVPFSAPIIVAKLNIQCRGSYLGRFVAQSGLIPNDLILSAALTSDQRKELHAFISQFDLQHMSVGNGTDRRLVVSRLTPRCRNGSPGHAGGTELKPLGRIS